MHLYRGPWVIFLGHVPTIVQSTTTTNQYHLYHYHYYYYYDKYHYIYGADMEAPFQHKWGLTNKFILLSLVHNDAGADSHLPITIHSPLLIKQVKASKGSTSFAAWWSDTCG